MRKTVHLCLSSHQEVMYRSEADLNMGFNCLALAVMETESRLLGEGFMTTHNHKLVQTENPAELVRRERYAYSRYFNAKYSRRGGLGERQCFSLEVIGTCHLQTALNYVLRQGLHHGLAATPFGYPHCSANSFFRKELGKDHPPSLMSTGGQYKYLPHGKSMPGGCRMSAQGLILREDVLDTVLVEQLYITPRNFLFQMNRFTDEKIVQEQMQENDSPPVTLDSIENGVNGFDLKAALVSEGGRVNNSFLTDLELCRIIDEKYLPHFLLRGVKGTVYTLSHSRRADLGNALWKDVKLGPARGRPYSEGLFVGRKVTVEQIRRCLAL
ncbi:MAG: hypothetical protein J5801_05295 [Bacteroidales bacterium]|nr:hypothetical protein [Bacteroidales bacterium]